MPKDLTPEAAEARRAYYRAWRAKNKDKTQEYERRKWERAAKKAAEAASPNT